MKNEGDINSYSQDYIDELGEKIAYFTLAESEMNIIRNYITNGRIYKETNIENLVELFVDKFRAYVGQKGAEVEFDEVFSEFKLRQIEPPYELVKPEIEILTERVKKISLENLASKDTGMVEAYFEAQKSKQ